MNHYGLMPIHCLKFQQKNWVVCHRRRRFQHAFGNSCWAYFPLCWRRKWKRSMAISGIDSCSLFVWFL